MPSALQWIVRTDSVASGVMLSPIFIGSVLVASHIDSLLSETNVVSSAAGWPSMSATTCGIYLSTLHTRIVCGTSNAVPTVESLSTMYLGNRLTCPGSNGKALSGCWPSLNNSGPRPYGFSLRQLLKSRCCSALLVALARTGQSVFVCFGRIADSGCQQKLQGDFS